MDPINNVSVNHPTSNSANERYDVAEYPNDPNDAEKEKYFWGRKLHEEFMRHFSVFGKTWKVISQKLSENGILNKDQL